jgi:ribonuclease G
MLHRDIPLPMKVARDFFDDTVDEMIVDSEEAFETILEDCDFLSPLQRASLELYKDSTPIFENFAIEKQIENALSRKIWLNSGGYIYFDKTEAMHCIDVNSGRFSGGKSLEETVFKVNLEAAEVIARQIRLRNLSGMIIIDFIDMESREHRNKVLRKLREGFRGDRNKPNVLDFSELGLIQMTRRRTSANLIEIRKEICPCCHGSGRVLSLQTITNKVKQLVIQESKRCQTQKIAITAHKTVIDFLRGKNNQGLKELQNRVDRRLILKTTIGLDVETFKVEAILDQQVKKKKNEKSSNKSNKKD